jgi:SAM-dependent methyltransferase
MGHHVTGVDLTTLPGLETRVDRFIAADLDHGLPACCERGDFDIVVAADVLEHVREPEMLLDAIHQALTPAGILVVSVPNFGHWYPRGRTALGLFDYDQRGLLDRGHIRLFTRRGILARLRQAHFAVKSLGTTGIPTELLISNAAAQRAASAVGRLAVAVWPTLFGYQFVLLCHPVANAGGTTCAQVALL